MCGSWILWTSCIATNMLVTLHLTNAVKEIRKTFDGYNLIYWFYSVRGVLAIRTVCCSVIGYCTTNLFFRGPAAIIAYRTKISRLICTTNNKPYNRCLIFNCSWYMYYDYVCIVLDRRIEDYSDFRFDLYNNIICMYSRCRNVDQYWQYSLITIQFSV